MILIIIIILLISIFTQTPESLLRRMENKLEYNAVSEILYSTNENEIYFVFYKNKNKNLACGIFEKKWGNYKLLEIASELSLKMPNKENINFRVNFITYYYQHTKQLIMGVTWDQDVAEIIINGKKCDFINYSSAYKVFYAINETTEVNTDTYKLYDKEGNELNPIW